MHDKMEKVEGSSTGEEDETKDVLMYEEYYPLYFLFLKQLNYN